MLRGIGFFDTGPVVPGGCRSACPVSWLSLPDRPNAAQSTCVIRCGGQLQYRLLVLHTGLAIARIVGTMDPDIGSF